MPRKSGALSVKQAAGGISSDHKLPGARRRPFADITNTLDVQLRRHDGPSSPPSQPLTLSGMAMQNMGGSKSSDSAGARNYLAESVVPAFPPHAAPLPGSVPCLKGDSIRLKPSVSLGSGTLTQFPHELGFSDGPAGNDILPCGAPEVKFPLPCSGTSMREPLSTSLLPPKTHKLACGQLAILPSRSVLVDFREGERRKGRKGDEVMVVSPNGHLVHFYSAPHLSTPCCLAEPIVSHSLNGLSVDQYKLYEQAKKVIEHIKRNVPKVVTYESNYVCTLMANEPRADIEIRTNPRSTNAAISVFSSEPRLCKKTMFCTARGVPTDAGDWALLSKDEKEGLAALFDFLNIVEAVEGLSRGTSEPPSTTDADQPPKGLTKREAAHSRPSAVPLRPESDASPPPASSRKSVATSTIPSLPPSTAPPSSGQPTNVTISPRPRFPSALPRASSDATFRKETRRRRSSPAQKKMLGAQACGIYLVGRACRPGSCRAWGGACALEGRATASCSRMAPRSRLTWMRNEWRWWSMMARSSDVRCASAARVGKLVIV
ncbi:hypothetical protein BC827DRAFT_21960 [Russula dissimulans]|nr:hypothetical protein BC827DRAFT_21960 [Russula dissimulans]